MSAAELARAANPPARQADRILVAKPEDWTDYALLDSGNGLRLECFGAYTLVRPDPDVLWRRSLSDAAWDSADATFQHGESRERWKTRRTMPNQWPIRYRGLTFYARLTPFKHTGVFPEQAVHWDWMEARIAAAGRPASVLSLFGYTGLAALVAARAGARVTYVDSSKWAMEWGRENQAASNLDRKPIRWLVDDALKFVKREGRRRAVYDGIVLDPPSFGRGPKGEVWKIAESLPPLLDAARAILSDQPLFVVLTAYAPEASALALANLMADTFRVSGGRVEAGELALREQSAGRLLPAASFARWGASG